MPRPSWRTALTYGIIISGVLLGGTNWRAAQSQPIADDTLGNERSVVVPLGASTQGDRIEGGARRGDNLFHSFQEFSVDAGRSVYFSDPGVNNIITRVTGGNSSQINDVLGVLGNANLFLINPSGIIFGANAQLDVGGSFTATTASAIEFNNQGNFSATNPTAPPLLTVQPSAFLFNQLNPAPIANNSLASTQTNPSGLSGFGLRVPNGKDLTLLGGNISMNGGGVNALGGRVEIAGLSAPGTVSRDSDGSLKFPTGIARADISLTNGSLIDVAANGGGTIAVNAGKFELLGSYLSAGIGNDFGFVDAQAGDITLDASTIVGGDGAFIRNRVGFGGIGNAGDIRIATDSLSLTNEVRLQASTFGQGNAGNVIIDARDRVAFDKSYIFSNVGFTNSDAIAVGNGGDISITTGLLSLTNGAALVASTLGEGDAGNVVINARSRILIDGVNPTRPSAPSAIFSTVGANNNANEFAVGNGGDISITTGSLSLTNGAQLIASTLGEGNAGNVIINARDRVLIDGVNSTSNLPSAILSSNGASNNANQFAVGNGGDISITTGSLFLTNGAGLQASTLGRGNAGNVIINARSRISSDGASKIFSSVGVLDANRLAVGNGGDIRITTGSLALTNGTVLNAFTLGQGNAGNVIINARSRISLDNSAILSSVGVDDADIIAVGNGGDIRITTGSLSLTSGAQLIASTLGQGNAGNVIIKARDRISLDGYNTTIFSTVGDIEANAQAVGNGGDISIVTGSLSLTDGAQLLANTYKQGNAGNIIINARALVSLEGVNQRGFSSGLFSATRTGAQGRGGDVSIAADAIRILNAARISTETFNRFAGGSVTLNANTFEATGGGQVITATRSSGEAGNITLNIADRITLSGSNPSNIPINDRRASGLYANTLSNFSGIGGTVKVTTGNLEVFDGATIAVSSEGEGRAGDIDITANRVQLNNSSSLSAETNTVDGGNITLRDVELLQLGNSSLISTTAGTDRAGGNGGNITIDSDLIVAFPNENSDIRANAFTGSGGNVSIDSQGLFGIAFQDQDNPLTSDITASSEQGLQGNVNITLPEIDPKRDLTQLPEEVVDVSSRIAQGCRSSSGARLNRGEFIVKGRGGLPPSPTDSLIGDESLANWVTLEQTTRQQTTTTIPTPEPNTAAAPIVEAQAWIVDENGKVTLVANAPTNATQTNLICQKQENK